MKRASYREAVEWIAQNGGAGDNERLEVDEVSFLVSSVLVADIFDVEPQRVGRDVVRKRKQLIKEGAL